MLRPDLSSSPAHHTPHLPGLETDDYRLAQGRRDGRSGTFSHGHGCPARGRAYTPYKVANPVLEFSTSIPRTQLRPAYGDGFLGAPLHVLPSRQGPAPQEQGDRRGTSSIHTAPDSGGLHRILTGPYESYPFG